MYSFLYGSHSHKSKSLAWYEGLTDFFDVDSLTKACISQNHFTSLSKIEKLQCMINPCFPLRRAFLLLIVESVYLLPPSSTSKPEVLIYDDIIHVICNMFNMSHYSYSFLHMSVLKLLSFDYSFDDSQLMERGLDS